MRYLLCCLLLLLLPLTATADRESWAKKKAARAARRTAISVNEAMSRRKRLGKRAVSPRLDQLAKESVRMDLRALQGRCLVRTREGNAAALRAWQRHYPPHVNSDKKVDPEWQPYSGSTLP